MKRKNYKKTKPTVTVAVSAYNEQKNIVHFLRSVLRQEQKTYRLKEIIVISDGSTDNTAARLQSLRHPKISPLIYDRRIGKSSRLNQLYKIVSSDILVQSDCDVLFTKKNTVDSLIAPILRNPSVGMTGGNPVARRAETFIESSINVSCDAYMQFRKKVRGGNNVFSADGRLLAFRKGVYSNARIPEDMIANDMFMYFLTLTKKFRYCFVEDAEVRYRSPQSIKDHIRQNTRFRAAPSRMLQHFGKGLVKREIHIPYTLYFVTLAKQFVSHPVESTVILIVNLYCRILAFFVGKNLNAMWQMAVTTKSV